MAVCFHKPKAHNYDGGWIAFHCSCLESSKRRQEEKVGLETHQTKSVFPVGKVQRQSQASRIGMRPK